MDTTISTRRVTSVALVVGLSHLVLEMSHNFLPVVYPLLIERMGLTYAQIGSLALITGIFGALVQPLFGVWSDRWDARWIVVISIAWIGVTMGIVGFVGFIGSYWLLAAVVGLAALGSAAFHPAGASLATAATKGLRGTSMSIFSVSGSLGAALSPIIVGV
ncbi:MAG: MFS transporter, partial [Anaerolineales bacterium]|nr:MFS transporter [Anaerolineales bacterium]